MPESPLDGLRLGTGYALVGLGAARPLRLAGIEVQGLPGTAGAAADDGDCICRAAVEALLSAAGVSGLAALFPNEPAGDHFADGLVLLSRVAAALGRSSIARLLQCHVQVYHPSPSLLQTQLEPIRRQLARALQLAPEQVGLGCHSLPGQLAQGPPGEAAASVTLLGVLRPVAADPPRAYSVDELRSVLRELEQPVPAAPVQRESTTRDWNSEEDDMPERARKFEQGLATKLYPLPAAPPPAPGSLLIVYTDGASRGNPGPAASGYCIMNELGQLVHEGGSRLGSMTNNQAEYNALVEAVEWIAKQLGHQYKLELRLDSQLVQRQLSGEYRIKDEELKELALYAMNQLMNFYEFKLVHIPRAENARADALANRALDGG
jgi:ribonuclease HI/2C-methyl-D-erythritol 2,4-cyclodiphosphate synthase